MGLHAALHVEDDKLHITHTQDCTPILAKVAAERRNRQSGDFRKAADLPMVIVQQYCNENGITFAEWAANPEHVKRMLNDPALKAFRVWPGKV